MTNSNLTAQSESESLKLLNELYSQEPNALGAAFNPQHSYWEQYPGGFTAIRADKLLKAYSNFPVDFFQLITTPNAEGLFPSYLELSSLVQAENRKVDIVLENPTLSEDGTVTVGYHLRMIQNKDGTLVKIRPEGNQNLNFSKGWKGTKNRIAFTKQCVADGAITEADYAALVGFCRHWAEQQELFLANKPEGSTTTSWVYASTQGNTAETRALAEAKAKILSLIPADTGFSFLAKISLNIYAPDEKTFNCNWGVEFINAHNLTFLGKGVSRMASTPINNGVTNASVNGAFLGGKPDYSLVAEKMPVMLTASVPVVPSLGQAIPTVASVAPAGVSGYTPEQLAIAKAAQAKQAADEAAVAYLMAHPELLTQQAEQITI